MQPTVPAETQRSSRADALPCDRPHLCFGAGPPVWPNRTVRSPGHPPVSVSAGSRARVACDRPGLLRLALVTLSCYRESDAMEQESFPSRRGVQRLKKPVAPSLSPGRCLVIHAQLRSAAGSPSARRCPPGARCVCTSPCPSRFYG